VVEGFSDNTRRNGRAGADILRRGNNGGDGLVAAGTSRSEREAAGIPACRSGLLQGRRARNWEIVHTMGIPVRMLVQLPKCAGNSGTSGLLRSSLTRCSAPGYQSHRSRLPTGRILDEQGLRRFIGRVRRHPVRALRRFGAGSGTGRQGSPDRDVRCPEAGFGAGSGSRMGWKVMVAPIGSPPALPRESGLPYRVDRPKHGAGVLPPRPRDSHKGAYGHVFVVAGSAGKSGAAIMTGRAALRSGAGLVTLFCPPAFSRRSLHACPSL